MKPKVIRAAYCVLLASLAGCSSLAPLLASPTPDSVSQATPTPQLLPTQTAVPPAQARILRVWLPARFDPGSSAQSANLLEQRLAEFESSHPGLKIEIRIKTEEGILHALTVTSNAAPSALPDLIALSRPDLESAALNGLLHPIDGLTDSLDDPNWYPYARELGHIQNIGYGLPFAGDALVLIHPPELQILSWEDIFASKEATSFPASDPQSLVALSLYVSAGGKLVNAQGQPTLEEAPLIRVLTLIENGIRANVFPPTVLNFESYEQSIQAYRDGRAGLAITWASNTDDLIHPIPGLDASHTFARGWMWALAGSSPENQQVAVELAEFLMDQEFLGEWIGETGYLPTRVTDDLAEAVILESARAIPSNDALAALGPIMNQALIRVLNGDQVEIVVGSVMDQLR